MSGYGLVETVRKLNDDAVTKATAARRARLPLPHHECECPVCLQDQRDAAEHEHAHLTGFPGQAGACCTPGVPLCAEPVHALLFWNMVQVLQQVCNVLNHGGDTVSVSAVVDALQGFATPQSARENPVVQALVEALGREQAVAR